jgi:hypothetical protein
MPMKIKIITEKRKIMFSKKRKEREVFHYNPLSLNDYYQQNNIHQKLMSEYKRELGGDNP